MYSFPSPAPASFLLKASRKVFTLTTPRARNPVRDLTPRQIINRRCESHQNCDPDLTVHLVSRKLPDCSGVSLPWVSIPAFIASVSPPGARSEERRVGK